MTFPNLNEEKRLWKQGFNFVAGLDEAGRGPLAGPVVAAAVCVNSKFKNSNLKLILDKVNDSKKLSEKQREEIYKILTNNKDIKWAVGIVSEKNIDKINILQATKLAMKTAAEKLNPDFSLIDGNFKLNIKISQKSIIKGDQKVFSISAASIIAKVTRDKIMGKMHKKYPLYGFDKHKGYGTKLHFESLEKFGPCKIHRKTFYPVSKYL